MPVFNIICKETNKYSNTEKYYKLENKLKYAQFLPSIGSSLVIDELLYKIYDIIIVPRIDKMCITKNEFDNSIINIYCTKIFDGGQHKRFENI